MFIHLHIQSSYSLLSSTVRIPELAEKAGEMGYPALALTDRNVMYGALYFYKECKKRGIKPIIGLLADILGEDGSAAPLLLLAENNTGYENLLKISSAIQTKSNEGLPVKWLRAYSKGLIALTPGQEGRIESLLMDGRQEEAESVLTDYQNIFGRDSFFLALQFAQTADAERLSVLIQEFAAVHQVPLAADQPVYYLNQEDGLAYEVLQRVKSGEKLEEDEWDSLSGNGFYLKSREEAALMYSHIPDALENPLKIADRCQVEIQFHRQLLPSYPAGEESAPEMLERICREGMEARKPDAPEAYWARLKYELQVIRSMNFSDYFLIVWDFVRFARKNGIRVGPGRGSAAGSMVAYVLFITDIDPIEHNLLFERFLNPERVTMPDIDIDFPDNRRDEVIQYVAGKYGNLHAAQIITFGTMAAKAALRDTGRVFGLNSKELDSLSNKVSGRTGVTIQQALSQSKELRDFAGENSRNQMLIETALKLEGLPRHTSTHAAGVVICGMPLTDIIAIQEGAGGVYLTQFPMDLLEELGLLKMDFLGLRNLSLLENIVQLVRKGTGKQIDLSRLPLDNKAAYSVLAEGETTGIFQFESTGITNVLKRLKPERFEDIVAVNALYRPGPMEFIPLFIDRKHGRVPIEYPHPELKDILKDTHGIIVYQEQIMQIASKLAGFSLGEADLLRRAVSKKKKEVLDQERRHFVTGAVRQGYSEKAADDVYDMIVRFANYGFNRSHAAAYSLIAYQLAYLKAEYPEYFMAALLTSSIGNDEKTGQYIREAQRQGMKVLLPSVNKSRFSFEVEADGIRCSLAVIKGIGRSVLKEIFAAKKQKPFDDLFDFCIRVSGKIVNRKILESLVYGGAFDEFGEDRATLLATLDIAISHAELVNPDGGEGLSLFEGSEFSLKPKYNKVEPIRTEDKLNSEKAVLGFYLSDHPAAGNRKLFEHFGAVTAAAAAESADKRVLLGVYISAVKTIRTKKGETMAFVTVSDESGDLEAVAFPEQYRASSSLLKTGGILMLEGNLEERNERKQLVIKKVYPLEACRKAADDSSRLFIRIDENRQTASHLKQIKQLLLSSSGMTKVMLYYAGEERYIQLPLWEWVSATEGLVEKLENICGSGNIVLKTK